MENLAKLIKILGYVDYAVSLGVLAYGIYQQNWLYIAVGVFGLVVAYLKPAERVKSLVSRKFTRKPTQSADIAPEEAITPSAAGGEAATPSYRPRPRYISSVYYVGYVFDYTRNICGRLPVRSPGNLIILLYIPRRVRGIGVRATSIIPRDKR